MKFPGELPDERAVGEFPPMNGPPTIHRLLLLYKLSEIRGGNVANGASLARCRAAGHGRSDGRVAPDYDDRAQGGRPHRHGSGNGTYLDGHHGAAAVLSAPAAPEALANECDALANEQLGHVDRSGRAWSAHRSTAAVHAPSFPSPRAAPVHEALANEPVEALANEQSNTDAPKSMTMADAACSLATSADSPAGVVTHRRRSPRYPRRSACPKHCRGTCQ